MSSRTVKITLNETEAALVDLAAAKSGRAPMEWLYDALRGSLVLYETLGGQPAPQEPIGLTRLAFCQECGKVPVDPEFKGPDGRSVCCRDRLGTYDAVEA